MYGLLCIYLECSSDFGVKTNPQADRLTRSCKKNMEKSGRSFGKAFVQSSTGPIRSGGGCWNLSYRVASYDLISIHIPASIISCRGSHPVAISGLSRLVKHYDLARMLLNMSFLNHQCWNGPSLLNNRTIIGFTQPSNCIEMLRQPKQASRRQSNCAKTWWKVSYSTGWDRGVHLEPCPAKSNWTP